MVKDSQVKDLFRLMNGENNQKSAAHQAGMDADTARKYLAAGKLPSQMKGERNWATRPNPFDKFWPVIEEFLKTSPGLDAKTIFEYLQRENPGSLQDGQLRTLQRRIKRWRSLEGPNQEIFFEQVHKPGDLCASDFTSMNALNITINREPFPHMLYHFVLTYSNWETGTICFSESFESLSSGFQNAIWKLGGVPKRHRSDRLSAAVKNFDTKAGFTDRYNSLLRHYKINGHAIQPRKPNENGDVEQSHFRFIRAVDQELMLRGSRDFRERKEYEDFLGKIFDRLNQGRKERLKEELKVINRLPARRLEDFKRLKVRVTRNSTIHVNHNIYSVESRLIGCLVEVRLYSDQLKVYYDGVFQEKIPRLRGEGNHRINYRHVIESLVRKPGAFENYKYKKDLFPTTYFRMVYDNLRKEMGKIGEKEYLKILHLAAMETEYGVNETLRQLLDEQKTIRYINVNYLVKNKHLSQSKLNVRIGRINLKQYDKFYKIMEKFENGSEKHKQRDS